MLNRRACMLALVSALALTGPVAAQDDAATRSVVRQLQEQGFTVTETSRTFLGRVRVISRRGGLTREVVFDPRNGAVLRDFTEGTGPRIRSVDDDEDDDRDDDDRGSGGGGGGGSGGADDNDDDDDNDDGGGNDDNDDGDAGGDDTDDGDDGGDDSDDDDDGDDDDDDDDD